MRYLYLCMEYIFHIFVVVVGGGGRIDAYMLCNRKVLGEMRHRYEYSFIFLTERSCF